MSKKSSPFTTLTWDEIQDWVGKDNPTTAQAAKLYHGDVTINARAMFRS